MSKFVHQNSQSVHRIYYPRSVILRPEYFDLNLMKKHPGIILTAIGAALLVSCSSPYQPESSPNPWEDDYSAVASMEHSGKWGTYNVHDPAVCKVDSVYYMYSTDAIYHKRRNHDGERRDGEKRKKKHERPAPPGFIQVRKSRDLVNWEFVGWAFPEIPAEAVEWVKSHDGGRAPGNIWAPYMVDCGNGKFHLYYCVSSFGKSISYLGVAESESPEGPWRQLGPVVRTDSTSVMIAIDPSVINTADGRRYMHYGSFFGGLFCVELNPETGLPLSDGDQGKLIARRSGVMKDNQEAPEIIRSPKDGKYYLFTSYDPLMTTYNVRVGRSDSPDGPFVDFFGKELADTTDNFPLLTAPYRFENHPGWVGTAHCGVFADADGNYYMAHQGRLASEPDMMVLHLRPMFFTPSGWPVVSPERYAATEARKFDTRDIAGDWEIIRLHEPTADRNLAAGQILWGEGALRDGEWNISKPYTLRNDGSIADDAGRWSFDGDSQSLALTFGDETIEDVIVFAGHDWERSTNTILFTGLDHDGRTVWGKRIK